MTDQKTLGHQIMEKFGVDIIEPVQDNGLVCTVPPLTLEQLEMLINFVSVRLTSMHNTVNGINTLVRPSDQSAAVLWLHHMGINSDLDLLLKSWDTHGSLDLKWQEYQHWLEYSGQDLEQQHESD